MAEIIFKSGIKRDKGLLYWARPDGIYGKKLKRAGESAGKETKIASHGQNLDYSKYMYFVVGDDLSLARSARQVGGSKRKKTAKKAAPKKAAAKKAAPKKAAKKPAKKAAPKKAAKKPAKKAGKKK